MFKSTLLKNYFDALRLNFFTLILFEFLYKALGTFILFPFFLHLMRNLITGFGTTLITTENILLVFQSTTNILIFLIIALVFLYYFLIEITTIIIGLNYGLENKQINIITLIKEGILTSLNYLSINNWLAFIFIIIFLPILHIGLKSGIAEALYLRLYLSYYTDFTFSISTLFLTVLIELVLLILFSNLFIYFVKFKVSILASCVLCLRSLKEHFKKSLKEVVKTILITFLLFVGIFLIFFILGIIAYLILFSSGSSTETYRLLIEILSPLAIGFFSLLAILMPLFYFSGLLGFHFKHNEITITENRANRRLKAALISVIIITFCVFQGSVTAKSISEDALTIAQTGAIITAHRGNSSENYESTQNAFESAIQNGAEYLECDIQRTKDGILVINHTIDVPTVDGLKRIRNMNFADLRQLEIINNKTKEPTGQFILTLDELLTLAKDRAKLNIELKKIQNDTDLVDQVVSTVKDFQMEDDVYIASGNYPYVLEIEEKYPELNSLFLTSSNYGDIENFTFDSLSLEQEAIDQDTVDRIHLRGKMIQAWTLDNKEEILNMLNKNVDYLIVNDVHLAQTILAEHRPDQAQQLKEILALILYKV